jgi:hypothetical protein
MGLLEDLGRTGLGGVVEKRVVPEENEGLI